MNRASRRPEIAITASPSRRVTAPRNAPRQVRIIGGDWKRRALPVPDLEGLRPTPDRVRETVFNWLGQRLEGWRCLDLFAGTGALGFEAASRGASRVVMVERQARAAKALHASCEKLSATHVNVIEADGLKLAAGLPPASFDLVFLDPPFETDLLARALPLVAPLLSVTGLIYVESAVELMPKVMPVELEDRAGPPIAAAAPFIPAGWGVLRYGRAGAVHFHLLQRESKE
jgi:16S rRNA (guanine966-N2)-methyltransferase